MKCIRTENAQHLNLLLFSHPFGTGLHKAPDESNTLSKFWFF